MMEVNRNTALEFGDLMTSASNSNDRLPHEDNSDIGDDIEMVSDLKSPLSKEDNDSKHELITNGQLANIESTAVDIDVADFDSTQITPELEDKLLADDETDVVDKLLAEVVPSTVLDSTSKLDNVTTTVSVVENVHTESTETLRNPGDDLDTLLSKINDIVDECIEPEKNKTVEETDLISFDNTIETNTVENKLSDDLDESVILLDDSAVDIPATDNSKMEEEDICKNSLDDSLTEDVESATLSQKHVQEHKNSVENDDDDATTNKEKDVKSDVLSANDDKSTNAIQPKATSNEQNIDNITESDQVLLEVDLGDQVDKSTEEKDIISDDKIMAEEETSHVSDLDNVKGTSELEDLEKIDEEVPNLNENNAMDEPQLAAVESTDEIPKPTPVISVDVDDSDDDVVFFCDNSKNSLDAKQLESEEKNEAEKKSDEEEKVEEDIPKDEVNANSKGDEDDEVVLLDDDEDDNPPKSLEEASKEETDSVLDPEARVEDTNDKVEKPESKNTVLLEDMDTNELTSKERRPEDACTKMPIDDESDNAKDKFDVVVDDKKLDKDVIVGVDAEETNSNCSSSSNLLQEAKPVSEEVEEETDLANEDDEDMAENESETAGTEVDIIEGDIAEDDSKESAPPAKRIRLSTDDDDVELDEKSTEVVSVSKDMNEIIETEKSEDMKSDIKDSNLESQAMAIDTKSDDDKNSLKRSLESLESDEKFDMETYIKKPKTDDVPILKKQLEKTESKPEENMLDVIEIPDSKEDEDDTDVKCTKENDEANAAADVTEEKVEVLPVVKAVPSHIPIPLYPPPQFQETAAELNLDFLKRFKKSLDQMTKIDLEELVLQKIVEAIIHKSEFGEMRELIEKQEKIISSHRTKITELSKQFRDLEMVHNRVLKDIEVKNSQFLMPVKITRAVGLQVFIPHKKALEPAPTTTATASTNLQQSPPSQYRPLNNSGSQLTSPSRQSSIDSAVNAGTSSRLANTVLASATISSAMNARRGCTQKVTPQRPIDTLQTPPLTYRTPTAQPTLQQQQNPTKLLNKSVSSAPAQIRNRYSGPSSVVQQQQQQQQQQLARQQPSPTNQIRKLSPAQPSTIGKPQNSNIAQQYRRPDSIPQATNSPVPENYMSSIHQIPPGMSAVSITPAKPKEKSVIDLTDEDDAPSSAVTATVVRRPLNGPNSSSTSAGPSNYVLNKLPTNPSRIPPNQSNKAQSIARQQLSSIVHGPKTNGNPSGSANKSTPQPDMSITRMQIPSRKVYNHPAPLPPTPTQNLNPAWKLPPPRPTIRISNLDNGIVISWTVEESMDRHADCVSYQIYAYQETSGPALIDSWRHVGDVKAMLLPMAVTLTQFQEGQRYYFAVRAVDVHHRVGPFSLPKTWS